MGVEAGDDDGNGDRTMVVNGVVVGGSNLHNPLVHPHRSDGSDQEPQLESGWVVEEEAEGVASDEAFLGKGEERQVSDQRSGGALEGTMA